MSAVHQQTLELLSSNLWGRKPSTELFSGEVDWNAVINCAQKQAILGAVYSQIEHLESHPPKATMFKLHTLTTLNRKMYVKQLQTLQEVTRRLQAIGIERPVLLKGVGVSANYPDPGVRQCGDIDIYVGKEHYQKACLEAQKWSESVMDEHSISHKHYHFLFDGIPIEIHRLVISDSNITRNASKFSKWCVDSLEGDNIRCETIEGVEVYLPPYNFDAIYIFYHAWNHFCSYGIAFRQICDWCRYLSVYKDKIDQKLLKEQLEQFGLERPWGFFASIATKLLGCKSDDITAFDPNAQWCTEKVAQRIWEGGNFGFYGGRHAGIKGNSLLRRKFVNFFSLFYSFSFLYSIDRRYSINFLLRTPLNSVKANIMQLYYIITQK